MKEPHAGHDKIAIIGTGMVGSSFAYALVQSGLAEELILIDADAARADGEAMDLNHGLPFLGPMQIRAGGDDDLRGCRLVVITAGANQRPGQTRLELLAQNAAVIRDIIPRVVRHNPDGLVLVATNPVDVLTQIASDAAGLAPGRVFGSGTLLDTARFRYLLGQHYGVDPRSVHASIIGEHGDGEIAVWSLAQIAGMPLNQFVGPQGHGYDPEALDQILEQTRSAAETIIRKKRATYYAIGLSLLAIVRSVLRDQHTVMTVTSPVPGLYGVRGISASLPTVLDRRGASHVLELPLSPGETEAFVRCCENLRTHWQGVQ